MTSNPSVTVYCDEAGTEKEDHYTIAAIILPDAQADNFTMQINCLKKAYFPNKSPDDVIFHYSDIQGRSGIYSKTKMLDDNYAAFKYDLCKLVMEQLKPEIAAFYFGKKELSELRSVSNKILKKFPKSVNVKKPSAYVMAYFFMIPKLQDYFVEKNVQWKISAEVGNEHFGRLVDYFEENRDAFAFDLVGNLDRNLIGKRCMVSKRENVVQIADLVAGTINDWQKIFESIQGGNMHTEKGIKAFTQWEQKRLLPYENLKKFFIWEEFSAWRVNTLRMRKIY